MSLLARHDVAVVRAGNPSPFTLTGTNTYVVGRNGAWVIDPGPALPAHVEAIAVEVERRGGLAGIALTHDHPDHAEGAPALRERLGGRASVAGMRGAADLPVADGDWVGPFEALATPGHAPDHLTYLLVPPAGSAPDGPEPAADPARDALAFTGDAVLGEGSVFIAPDPGALAGYLAGLERLRERAPALICPGHGPLVEDPQAKIAEYVEHRLARERALLDALAAGARTIDELLDAAWADAPPFLRPAATVTLAAHLDKLADENRLPAEVERPERPPWLP
ncbi:MAG TPA: MBL fold metallo-hydrolase [Conexibacter sp.]|nr:MBL fold metallo-hydrolase [Conexibacter sp.]